jgi:hypothetical protein
MKERKTPSEVSTFIQAIGPINQAFKPSLVQSILDLTFTKL